MSQTQMLVMVLLAAFVGAGVAIVATKPASVSQPSGPLEYATIWQRKS